MRRRGAWRYGLVGIGVVLAMAAGVFVVVPSVLGVGWLERRASTQLTTVPVRRTDLSVTMTTGGRVDSSDKTVIACELEDLGVRSRGPGMSASGSSRILTIVPDGSVVKKDDVLCTLDSSEYEELLRSQSISVEQARADMDRAKLALEVAEMALAEYTDGLMGQARKTLSGQIALSQSDYERALDRLTWTRRMVEKGYLATGQLVTEQFALNRLELNLKKGRTALDLFERFAAPKYIFMLKGDVLAAEAVYTYQRRRFQLYEERLAKFKEQIEFCTVRAPHDGFVIYANDDRRNIRIEAGMTVREEQKLFYLPNLARMEVAAVLHESVVKSVQPGMRAQVKIEALPNRVIEGHIDAITQLPDHNWFSDIRYFYAKVKLHDVPRGLKPGMSAEVEIVTSSRPDVLVIPPEALTVEEGRDVCYVAHDNALERREVTLGQATRDYLEVVEGLDEGESVVIEPELATTPVVVASGESESQAGEDPSIEPGQ